MTITINAQGSERKRLVQCISHWLGCEPNYLGAPTFSYQVDYYFTIEKNGSLTFDDGADREVIERLLQHIYDEGFDIDQSHTIDAEETNQVCISLPRSRFTDSGLENLKAILTAKGGLIQKALGVRSLPIAVTEEKVSFPWFSEMPTPEELSTYEMATLKNSSSGWVSGSTSGRSPSTVGVLCRWCRTWNAWALQLSPSVRALRICHRPPKNL